MIDCERASVPSRVEDTLCPDRSDVSDLAVILPKKQGTPLRVATHARIAILTTRLALVALMSRKAIAAIACAAAGLPKTPWPDKA